MACPFWLCDCLFLVVLPCLFWIYVCYSVCFFWRLKGILAIVIAVRLCLKRKHALCRCEFSRIFWKTFFDASVFFHNNVTKLPLPTIYFVHRSTCLHCPWQYIYTSATIHTIYFVYRSTFMHCSWEHKSMWHIYHKYYSPNVLIMANMCYYPCTLQYTSAKKCTNI